MAHGYATVPKYAQQVARTPAERAAEARAVQLRLKQEAAARRTGAAAPAPVKRPAG